MTYDSPSASEDEVTLVNNTARVERAEISPSSSLSAHKKEYISAIASQIAAKYIYSVFTFLICSCF